MITKWRGQTDFALDLANYADLKPCARMAYGDFLFASLLDMRDRQFLWDKLLLARTDVQLADMLITLNPDLFARMAFTLMPTVLDQWLNAMGLTVSDYLSSVDGYVLFGAGYSDLLKETLMAQGHASNGWRYAVAEHHLYGSSRIGLHQTQLQLRERKPDLTVVYASVSPHVAFYRRKRNCELSNHLGNFNGCWFCEARLYSHESRERSGSGVQATLSDKRRSVCNEELGIAYFEAELLTQTDYYPFGAVMPDRQWSAGAGGYRYGFDGMERVDEVKGCGNSYTTESRQYDPQLGRWLGTDPEYYKFYGKSPFVAFSDNPMIFIDPRGNTDYYRIKGKKIGADNDPIGKKVIVLGRVNERQIRRDMKKNQKVVSSNIERTIPVVSDEVIRRLDDIYCDPELNNTQEAGFVSGINSDGKEVFSDAIPIPNRRALDMDPVVAEQMGKGATVEIMAHGHPFHENTDVNGISTKGGYALPSTVDTQEAGRYEEKNPDLIGIVAGYDLPTPENPYASGDKTLNFYSNKDHNKPIETRGVKVNFNEYKAAIEKINK